MAVKIDIWATWGDGMGGTFRAGRYVNQKEELVATNHPSQFAEFYKQPCLSQKLLPAPRSE